MLHHLIWTVVSGVLVPAQSGPATRPAERPTAIRVMTFNIRYGLANDGEDRWQNRRELVFDVLRRHRPDLVGLQEALRFQIDEIRRAVPGYEEIGVGRDDGQNRGEYSNILYRADRFRVEDSGTFWLSDTPEVPGSRSWGNQLPRICTWARLADRKTGRVFHMFNTHLDHQSQPARERGIELIARRIADRRPRGAVILTGDFNAAEDNPVVRFVRGDAARAFAAGRSTDLLPSPRLRDSFRVLHPDERIAGTFNGFQGRTDGPKIDYVLVSPGVEVLQAEIVRDNRSGRYPSDHFPVTAVIVIPTQEPSEQ